MPLASSGGTGAATDSPEKARGSGHSFTASVYRRPVLSSYDLILRLRFLFAPLHLAFFPINFSIFKNVSMLLCKLPHSRRSYSQYPGTSATLSASLHPRSRLLLASTGLAYFLPRTKRQKSTPALILFPKLPTEARKRSFFRPRPYRHDQRGVFLCT